MIYNTIYNHINNLVNNYPWEWEGVGPDPSTMTFTGRKGKGERRYNSDIIITILLTGTTISITIEAKKPLGKPGYNRAYTYETITFTTDLTAPNSIELLEQTITRTLNKAWQVQQG